jgi:hypothetical protein
MGIGLGNAGLQANGVSLDPNAIEQIDREFDPEREGIEPSEILYFTVVMSF